MSGGPPVGNPFEGSPPRENRFIDRAHLLGDAARTGRATRGEEPDAQGFKVLLEEEVEKKKGTAAARKNAKEDPDETASELARARPAEGAARDVRSEAGELERRMSERGRSEVEKRAGAWRGPILTAGLPAAAGMGMGVSAQDVEARGRARREQEAPQGVEISPGEAMVDPDLLSGLRDAGLADPLRGLHDPRLAGATPRLPGEAGWRDAPGPGGGVLFSWEGPSAYQRLQWSEGHVVLESAAGERVQSLERQGSQLYARLQRREVPPSFPGPL